MVGYIDDSDRVLEIAGKIERGEWHAKLSPAITAAASLLLKTHKRRDEAIRSVTQLANEAGRSNFVIMHQGREGKYSLIDSRSWTWSDGEAMEIDDGDPRVQQLLESNRDLNRQCDELGKLLEPIQPRNWRGNYELDVTNLAELKTYLNGLAGSVLFWFPGNRAVAETAEATLNADFALREWGYAFRPPIPPTPLTNDEAARQLAHYIRWIDEELAAAKKSNGELGTQNKTAEVKHCDVANTPADSGKTRDVTTNESAAVSPSATTQLSSDSNAPKHCIAPPPAGWDGTPSKWNGYSVEMADDYGREEDLLRDAFIFCMREAGHKAQAIRTALKAKEKWSYIDSDDSYTNASKRIALFFRWEWKPVTRGRQKGARL